MVLIFVNDRNHLYDKPSYINELAYIEKKLNGKTNEKNYNFTLLNNRFLWSN